MSFHLRSVLVLALEHPLWLKIAALELPSILVPYRFGSNESPDYCCASVAGCRVVPDQPGEGANLLDSLLICWVTQISAKSCEAAAT